jgi:hypothetical protein
MKVGFSCHILYRWIQDHLQRGPWKGTEQSSNGPVGDELAVEGISHLTEAALLLVKS